MRKYYCTDRTCGGEDCKSCYPVSPYEEEEEGCDHCGYLSCKCDDIEHFKEEREERRWMEQMDRRY